MFNFLISFVYVCWSIVIVVKVVVVKRVNYFFYLCIIILSCKFDVINNYNKVNYCYISVFCIVCYDNRCWLLLWNCVVLL